VGEQRSALIRPNSFLFIPQARAQAVNQGKRLRLFGLLFKA
jgi:hypothetical protein